MHHVTVEHIDASDAHIGWRVDCEKCDFTAIFGGRNAGEQMVDVLRALHKDDDVVIVRYYGRNPLGGWYHERRN